MVTGVQDPPGTLHLKPNPSAAPKVDEPFNSPKQCVVTACKVLCQGAKPTRRMAASPSCVPKPQGHWALREPHVHSSAQKDTGTDVTLALRTSSSPQLPTHECFRRGSTIPQHCSVPEDRGQSQGCWSAWNP